MDHDVTPTGSLTFAMGIAARWALAACLLCAAARAQDYVVTKPGVRVECVILEEQADKLVVKIKGKKYYVKKAALREWKRASAPGTHAGRADAETPEVRAGVKARVDFLVKKLAQPGTDSNPIDHRALAEGLASLLRRKDAAEYARHLLRGGPEGARGWLALALARAGVKGAAPELLDMLNSYAPGEAPAPLIEALGHFGGKGLLSALVNVYPALSPPAKAAAATAIGRTKDRRAGAILVRLLEEDDYDIRTSARMALVPIAKEDGELAEMIFDKVEDSKHQEEYARLFGKLDDPSCLPILRNMLKYGDDMTKRAAAAAVARYKDAESAELLLDIASDEDSPRWLRSCCLSSLKSIGNKSVAYKLVELLESTAGNRRLKRKTHEVLRDLTGKDLPANPSLWKAAVTNPETTPVLVVAPTPAPVSQEVILPRESRPTGPPPEERRRRAYVVWIAMGVLLVTVIGGHKAYCWWQRPRAGATAATDSARVRS